MLFPIPMLHIKKKQVNILHKLPKYLVAGIPGSLRRAVQSPALRLLQKLHRKGVLLQYLTAGQVIPPPDSS